MSTDHYKHLTDAEARENGRLIVEALRKVRADALARLDEFTLYVEQLAIKVEADATIPQSFVSPQFATRALEALETINHIHTGSSAHMHYRSARDLVLESLAGERLGD